MQNGVPIASCLLYRLPMASFSSYCVEYINFKSSKIFFAYSGKPSFLTKGSTANFIGAKKTGNFNTFLIVPSVNLSSLKDQDKTAKNILSSPIDVSTTYGI